MPYKLRITNEEVENELKKIGFNDVSTEMIESFRKDLLKIIKNDLRKLKKLKENQDATDFSKDFQSNHFKSTSKLPATSTPSSECELELERERFRYPEGLLSKEETISSAASEDEHTLSEGTSKQASSIASEAPGVKETDEQAPFGHQKPVLVATKKKKPVGKTKPEELPAYPEKVDPVNLYHYYKAFWDKYKVPGEDPRSALRWEVRSKLFYAPKDL